MRKEVISIAAGGTSVRVTLSAVIGPMFVTRSVKGTRPPTRARARVSFSMRSWVDGGGCTGSGPPPVSGSGGPGSGGTGTSARRSE